MKAPTKILIVDDHVLFREGLVSLLQSEPGYTVIGEASSGEEALYLIPELRPDVVLMDVKMPGIGGVEATRRLLEAHPEARVLMLTVSEEEENLFKSIDDEVAYSIQQTSDSGYIVVGWTDSHGAGLTDVYLIRLDQWSGEIIKQLVDQKGIKRFDMVNHTAMINDSQYKNFSLLLHTNKLKMPDTPIIKKDFLALQCEEKGNGIIKVEGAGGVHDDLFDAMVRSLYLCHSYHTKNFTIAGHCKGLFNKQNPINRGRLGSRNLRLQKKIREKRGIRNPTVKQKVLA